MNAVDEKLPDILLSANRLFCMKDYLKYGYDFMLLGHAHGGQWRIPYMRKCKVYFSFMSNTEKNLHLL